MRLVFFGTPAFAVPSLDALLSAGHTVAAVVTQPDRPRTRSHSTLLPSPVKQRALEAGIPVLQPDRPRGDEFLDAIRALKPDVGVVVAYGHILRPELLAIPPLGMVNVHASLLPRWRGAAPIQWAVLSGDAVTGVSIMRMEAGLDSGPLWLAREEPINPHDTSGMLFERLARVGASALVEALPSIGAGARPEPQDESRVTLAPKLDRNTARVDWSRDRDEISCRIRAMDPAPGAWTTLAEQPVKLFHPSLPITPDPAPASAPGTIIASDGELLVACGDGPLAIGDLQPAGRRRLAAGDWLRGNATAAGQRFV